MGKELEEQGFRNAGSWAYRGMEKIIRPETDLDHEQHDGKHARASWILGHEARWMPAPHAGETIHSENPLSEEGEEILEPIAEASEKTESCKMAGSARRTACLRNFPAGGLLQNAEANCQQGIY